MTIAPAESSCCGLSLVQGVHTLATYAVFNGIFSLLALVVGPSTTALDRVMQMHNAFHSVGILFGMRGFSGLQARNIERLHYFAFYFPYAWVVNVVFEFLRLPFMCDEVKEIEKKNPKVAANGDTCRELIISSFLLLALQGLLFAYFTYIIWSLSVKFQSSEEHGLLDPHHQLAQAMDLQGRNEYHPQQASRTTSPTYPPLTRPPVQPFSGQPYKL